MADLDADLRKAAAPGLLAVAERIAAQARANAAMHALKSGTHAFKARVVDNGTRVVVSSTSSFAHLEESGTARRPGRAPLRRAALVAGRFTPRGPQ